MIVIAGTFNVDPANRDSFAEAAKAVMAETVKEEGCHTYVFSLDIVDPGVVHILEKWESEDNLKPHLRTDHIKTFGRAMKELKVSGTKITIYEVASEKQM
jgi:quinol monooxygenase YgiN